MARNRKTQNAATPKASQDFDNLAPRFVALVRNQAEASGTVKRQRLELAHIAGLMWSKPVTVAEAAKGLDLDLSVKDQPKDSPMRGEIQRQRVTLQRALLDAGLLLKDAGKGRKAGTGKDTNATEGEGDKADGPEGATVQVKMTQAEVILKALPYVRDPKELRAIIKAAQAQLAATRHLSPVTDAPAQLAATI